jgi:hypothetical protein
MGRFVRGAESRNENFPSAVELAGFAREILRVRSTHRQPRAGDASGSKGKTSQSNVSSYRNCKFHSSRDPKFCGFSLVVTDFHADADWTGSRQERLVWSGLL